MREQLRHFGWPVLVGVLAALVIMGWFPEWIGLVKQQEKMPTEITSVSGPSSYASAVSDASPAVVNLYSTKVVSEPIHPLFADPALKHFFGDSLPQQRRLESSLGSAVIMSPEGYLLTNNHVIAGADQVVVALKDGRETLAQIIGSDPETDLAVLKIDLPNLPVIKASDSEHVRIGDVVLAIGNPFGVGQTVTMGIISATGRHQLGINNYEDFIQTDAAINPGNSGGALIDTYGRLLGINTAIFSRSGGSQGIGFAIPVKPALAVMESIIEYGHVVRGWLGLEVQTLTPELAETFGLKQRVGVLVAGVLREGPAAQAGLLPGDIVLSFDGQPAVDGRSSMNQVANMRPGKQMKMEVLRFGEKLVLKAEVGTRPVISGPQQ